MINTLLFQLIFRFEKIKQFKIKFIEKNFAFSIFFLFLGFICGNLFGTFLTFFRYFIYWDGAIIMLTIVFIELINFLYYTKPQRKTQTFQDKSGLLLTRQPKTQSFIIFVNFYKVGILIGFFTDAFKVGS